MDISTSIEALAHPGQAAVERALSELRAGRPVVLSDQHAAALVVGVEALSAPMAQAMNALGRDCRLVLSAPRLRHLGLERAGPGIIALASIEPERVQKLALSADARLDQPVASASPFEQTALELAKLALVLPAVVVASAPDEACRHLLRVRAAEVRDYRRTARTSLQVVGRAPVPLEEAGMCEFVVFRGGEGLRDQVAIIVGSPDLAKPVAVRLHSACLTGDLFGSLKCDCGDQLRHTVRWMAKNGGGVLLYLDQEGRGAGIANKMRAYRLQSQGLDTYDADEILGFEFDQRHYEFAAEMLRQIGVDRVRILTNNPHKVEAMKRAGLDVVAEQRVIGRSTAENEKYLTSKRDRAGHLIEIGTLVGEGSD